MADSTSTEASKEAKSGEYIVVARRYRPQDFTELVGQSQVAQALANAINTNRVGHAYLFTGARGVGKTSTARILAKALNCEKGPTPEPCGQCDICEGIASGDDVDVLEIDGASNRGIDEIRQLRANINVRPSRSRFKVYIIDEVHMLTGAAFNALLKTLEEPPEHVKFIFCTTDPDKIPITVLSRCQRFDFPPVEADEITARLQFIVEQEGIVAEPAALQLLARRAGGSMRDSQSLLEQLLSFCESDITVDAVYEMLGAAKSGRLLAISECLQNADAAGVLAEVNGAASDGVDIGQLCEQLLGHFRDLMVAAVGGNADLLLFTPNGEFDQLNEAAQRLGFERILAAAQVLDQTLTRAKQSTHTRVLVEMALVRICQLSVLDQIPELLAQLNGEPSSAKTATPKTAKPKPTQQATQPKKPTQPKNSAKPQETAEKKTAEPSVSAPEPPPKPADTSSLSAESAPDVWKQALTNLEDMGDTTADMARFAERIATSGPNRMVISFGPQYTFQKEVCERPEKRQAIEKALSRVAGGIVRVDFEMLAGSVKPPKQRATTGAERRQKQREIEKHPLVSEAMELFQGEVIDVHFPKQE